MPPLFGGIAQLGERLHGMQEVSGSIPLTSTNFLNAKTENPVNSRVFSIVDQPIHFPAYPLACVAIAQEEYC